MVVLLAEDNFEADILDLEVVASFDLEDNFVFEEVDMVVSYNLAVRWDCKGAVVNFRANKVALVVMSLVQVVEEVAEATK